jgi:hypothetical protein
MRLRTLLGIALLAGGCGGGTEPESPPPHVGVLRTLAALLTEGPRSPVA